ncbi:ABC transporter permease [Cohnella cellulosilytica]|uniref:ABC transporter permease n=1 Tax=Cohnella cellulosilytica TaxID=986710 RepID=A0ABW2FI36_9BACL
MLIKNLARDKFLLLMILPVVVYYIVFHYVPMSGIVIAFKNFTVSKGIWGSDWVGVKWFEQFFNSIFFWRLLRNTLLISVYGLLFGFWVPIAFALLLSELKNGYFKRFAQTVSYLPHFVSIVVVVGMMVMFLSPTNGVVNLLLNRLGLSSIAFFDDSAWFRTLYVGSDIWQSFGWNSIIYLAAIAGINTQLYEAAKCDGANRWRQIWHITLPGIRPTIMILLILSVGNMMNVGFEKILLMYNPGTYEVSDVISTYVYRRGILAADYSYGAAVGLFNSAVNFILLIAVNQTSRKMNQASLW